MSTTEIVTYVILGAVAAGALVAFGWANGPWPRPPEYSAELAVRADGSCEWHTRHYDKTIASGVRQTEASAWEAAEESIEYYKGHQVVKRVTIPMTDDTALPTEGA